MMVMMLGILMSSCQKDLADDIDALIKESIIYFVKQQDEMIDPNRIMYIYGYVLYSESDQAIAQEEKYPFSIIYVTFYENEIDQDVTFIIWRKSNIVEMYTIVPYNSDPVESYQAYVDDLTSENAIAEFGTYIDIKYGILNHKDIPKYNISDQDLDATPTWLITDDIIQLNQENTFSQTLGKTYLKKFECEASGSYQLTASNSPDSLVLFIYDQKGKEASRIMFQNDYPQTITMESGQSYYFLAPYRRDIEISITITKIS